MIAGLIADFLGAAMLLTRIPLGPFARYARLASRSVWAFPIVGGLIGGLGGACYAGLQAIGLPVGVAAVLSLAFQTVLGGGLHEDGLADTADGLGGGRTREQMLAIMRDSRIGSYGTLALIGAYALRLEAIRSLADPHRVALAMIVAGAVGRGAIVAMLSMLPPARSDGLATTLRPGWAIAILGVGIATAIGVMLSPHQVWSMLIVVCAAVGMLMMVIRRRVAGHTGDILGAASIIAECAVLASFGQD